MKTATVYLVKQISLPDCFGIAVPTPKIEIWTDKDAAIAEVEKKNVALPLECGLKYIVEETAMHCSKEKEPHNNTRDQPISIVNLHSTLLALEKFIATINSTGGVVRDNIEIVPVGDTEWPDLAYAYQLACHAVGEEMLMVESEDEDE